MICTVFPTRSSADANKPARRVLYRGQSMSTNMVPFDMLGMISY